MQIVNYEGEFHGLQNVQYWNGAGICNTPFNHCSVGSGETPAASLDSALEEIAMLYDVPADELNGIETQLIGMLPLTVAEPELQEDESFIFVIRYNLSSEYFTCANCEKNLPIQTNGGTGYGLDKDGNKICYECCAIRDRAEMDRDGKITLYLTYETFKLDGKTVLLCGSAKVTNWPGTLEYKGYVTKGKHNIAGSRYDVWFTDHDGKKWHGVQYGENTQICHCKRLKGQ